MATRESEGKVQERQNLAEGEESQRRGKKKKKKEREEKEWRQGYEKVKERVAHSYSLTRRVKFSAGFTARPTLASLVTQNHNVEASQKFRSNDTRTSPLFAAVRLNISL